MKAPSFEAAPYNDGDLFDIYEEAEALNPVKPYVRIIDVEEGSQIVRIFADHLFKDSYPLKTHMAHLEVLHNSGVYIPRLQYQETPQEVAVAYDYIVPAYDNRMEVLSDTEAVDELYATINGLSRYITWSHRQPEQQTLSDIYVLDQFVYGTNTAADDIADRWWLVDLEPRTAAPDAELILTDMINLHRLVKAVR